MGEAEVENEAEGGAASNEEDAAQTALEPVAARRKSWWAALLVLVGLAIATGAGLYFFRARKTHSAASAEGITQLTGKLQASGRPALAKRVRQACVKTVTCACRQAAARAALDADLHAEASAVLAADSDCAKRAKSRGMEAEALVRARKLKQGLAKAEAVLKTTPADPFATYAVAQAAYEQGDRARASQQARAAIAKGRGAPALLLLGLIRFRQRDYARAQATFRRMLELDPNDIDALYNLALIAQMQHRYHDAREGYLHVLRVAPKDADARYNLGVLTYSVGAVKEAHYDLAQLEKIVSAGDPRVKKLKKLFASPRPHRRVLTTAGAPSGTVPGVRAVSSATPPAPAAPSR